MKPYRIALAMALASMVFATARAEEPETSDAAQALIKALERLQDDPAALERARAVLESRLDEARRIEELRGRIEGLSRQIDEAREELKRFEGAPDAVPAAAPAVEPKAKNVFAGPKTISFNRDIRPIISENCFACHGPDAGQRKAGLRLDDGVGAFETLKSGAIALVGVDRSASELYRRITASDAADRMPPEIFEKKLTPEQIELLGRWIDEGSEYEKHWSFIAPARPDLPVVKTQNWARNGIDAFIVAKLEKEGLAPAPESERERLIRRVTFDLTGLPPTLGEVDAFVGDSSADAYEKVVDRLLASPRYGEHMARTWLDAARYADTNGYHIDNERFMWPWRDWVIDAFNRNMPFDEFTVEQLAGDLLPNPTQSQLIATGFNRNHMINFEGGAIPQEYQTAYVVDRVNTTGTVWLGITVNCAQCHDHKYDPITQKEFYQLYSFFNTIPEEGLDGREGNAGPLISAPRPEDEARLKEFERTIVEMETKLAAPNALLDAGQRAWEVKFGAQLARRWTTLDADKFTSAGGATLRKLEDFSILAEGENPEHEVYEIEAPISATGLRAIRLEALTHESLPHGGAGRADNANFVLDEIEAEVISASDPATSMKIAFKAAEADYSQAKYDIDNAIDGKADTGWAVNGDKRREDRVAVFVAHEPFGYQEGSILRIKLKHEGSTAHHAIGRFRLAVTADATMDSAELGDWYVNGPFIAEDGKVAYETEFGPENGVDLKAAYPDGRLQWSRDTRLADGRTNELFGDIAATYLYRTIDAPGPRKMTLAFGSNDALKVWINGEVAIDKNIPRTLTADSDKIEVDLKAGKNELLAKVVNYGNVYEFSFRVAEEQLGEIPLDVERLLAGAGEARTEEQAREVTRFFRRSHSKSWAKSEEELTDARKQKEKFEKDIPTAMVMKEMPEPRETFMLTRGQYDQPGEKVEPATPAALPPLPEGAPRDRLGLARWIVDPSNPLTARVAVNRIWERYFGTGLVKTSEDFGAQGEWPTHMELLDWLATEFERTGWDVKAMHRLIVTSATYRQSARTTPEIQARDPHNRLLARGPRYRLDAEELRDSALALSGLLVEKVGGPSVRPYQPPGLWEAVAYGAEFSAQRYAQDKGESLYRRSMYTFWKRQSPPPTMSLFDAPNREVCQVQRSRTNTPLQALSLMNDPQFVEAARRMAERVIKEGGAETKQRAAYAFRLATSRAPTEREEKVLLDLYNRQVAEYRANPEAGDELLGVGESARDAAVDACELAAWTTVTNLILNLDETITKG